MSRSLSVAALWIALGVLAVVLALLSGCGYVGGTAEAIDEDNGEVAIGFVWPPVLGEPYPDVQLRDHNGKLVSLSQFEGKTIVVEPVGMSCPGCQAFAGGHHAGGFRGVQPQPGLKSIEEYAPRYSGGVSLDDARIVFVQLLLYDMTAAQAPTIEDAMAWAEHFGTDRHPNRIVLVGDQRLIGPASYDMIPGFQLIDADFVLRSDSTGHHPRHNLYQELLPLLGDLVREDRNRLKSDP